LKNRKKSFEDLSISLILVDWDICVEKRKGDLQTTMSTALFPFLTRHITSHCVRPYSSTSVIQRSATFLPRFSPVLSLLGVPASFHFHQRKDFSTSILKMSTFTKPMEMKEAPVSDAAFIFNFFLRPLVPDLQQGVEGWAKAGARIAQHEKDSGKYLSTHLHMAISPESHFEIFNYAAFTDFTALPFLIATDPGAFAKIVGGGEGQTQRRPPMKAVPGGFREIKGLTRTPEKPSLPKRKPEGTLFIVACFAFEADIPQGPPPPGSPPGPPGLRPVITEAITKAGADFEADWIRVSGAELLSRHDAVNEIYLYRRQTHGVSTFVLRAEIDGDAAAAKDAADELRKYLVDSEFLRQNEMRPDVDVYEIVVNGNGRELEPNRFGVV